MNPLLTIIIPCYNCEHTLSEAVNSCFRQGLDKSSFDIIMVDDCSTDDTKKIMAKIAEKYDNVKCLFHTTNLGGGATRNTAAANSTSEVLFCLDSDDMLGDNTLSKMLKFLHNKHCDAVGISTSIKFKGKNLNNVAYVSNFGYVGKKIPFISLFSTNEDGSCSLYSTFMITRSAFNTIGGYPTNHGFDTQGMAFRFLAAGLVAFTCPDTTYYHRVDFHKSYYLREYESGKVNYNLKLILEEFIYIFNDRVKNLILEYDINSEENILEMIKSNRDCLVENYEQLLLSPAQIEKIAREERLNPYWLFWLGNNEYVKRNYKIALNYLLASVRTGNRTASTYYKLIDCLAPLRQKDIDDLFRELSLTNLPNKRYRSKSRIITRLLRKLKKIIKSIKVIYYPILYCYIFVAKCFVLIREGKEYRKYCEEIQTILELKKEVVFDIQYGGIGDWLAYSSLPRLLKVQYGVDFYITEQSLTRLRNVDILKLCFGLNPYFKGVKISTRPFVYKKFVRENRLKEFIFDKGGKNVIETIENQFHLTGNGLPEIYYKPTLVKYLNNVILIDENSISGKRFGWKFQKDIFYKEAVNHLTKIDRIEHIDPKKQDLFGFVDMIYSCKYYIGTSSGGAAISACLNKPFSVILPYNAMNSSVYNFCFFNSRGKYLKSV